MLKSHISFHFQVCQDEKQSGKLQIPLTSAKERAANYTGVSQSMLYPLQKGDSKNKGRLRADKIVLDDFDKGMVRHTVKRMLIHQQLLPTVKT